MNGVIDTSVFVAAEQGRPLDADKLPAQAAISVATLAELELGVLMASSAAERDQRTASLRRVVDQHMVLPIDTAVASAYAELQAMMRRAGRRPNVQDTWIAATARAHGVAVYTQDADFDHLPVDVVRV
ncbi:MAG: ribonuclease [Conexibacter sp.]|nr:ribonuclease [Conexibacter sp.]